jgi:ADP-ribose pyrophosphatase YjhB (NUDIX family)
MPHGIIERRSARVILLSPQDEVLLIQFIAKRSAGEFAFWATPGGEVEGGESDLAAAQRELREELSLALALEGPVHSAASEFEHQGAIVSNTDVFFTARCARDAPRLNAPTEEERAAMRRWRWWSADEIASAETSIFPEDLEAVLRRLLRV